MPDAPDPLITDLRTLRLMLGVRATDIAEKTGLNLASISNWETGRYGPHLHTFRQYAQAIGYDLRLVSAAADDAHLLPLYDLTADEVQALTVAAAKYRAIDTKVPALNSALDKLRTPVCGHELHGADGGPCPACGWDSHPIPDQPAPADPTDLPALPA